MLPPCPGSTTTVKSGSTGVAASASTSATAIEDTAESYQPRADEADTRRRGRGAFAHARDVEHTVSNMKRATAREVQHGLSDILSRVEKGEEFEVTRRGKVVARLVPARQRPKKRPAWPDFYARLVQAFPHGQLPGSTISDLIAEDRDERL